MDGHGLGIPIRDGIGLDLWNRGVWLVGVVQLGSVPVVAEQDLVRQADPSPSRQTCTRSGGLETPQRWDGVRRRQVGRKAQSIGSRLRPSGQSSGKRHCSRTS
jgi:hypothetical protein